VIRVYDERGNVIESHDLKGDFKEAPVFPTLGGKAGGGKSGLSMAFKRIMGHAEIQGRLLREANGEGRSQSSLSVHSPRHSFNSAMANAGVAPEVRQKLTGHSSADMNRIYTHHELEPLRARGRCDPFA